MKRAVVTGAAGALGRAFCNALADSGYQVLGADNDPSVASIRKDGITPVCCDLAREDQLATLTDLTQDTLDVLVNCAGVYRASPLSESWQASLDGLQEVLDNNLRALLLPSRALIPRLVANGGGHIVNLTSRDVLPANGQPTNGACSDLWLASQWAVNGATDAWATRLASAEVKVNALCVAGIKSPLTEALPDYDFQRPLIKAADVATLLIELINSDLTGENIGYWPGRTGHLRPPRARHRQITG
ncbi:MAG: SDR family oxidoreductase [Pseudomonadaceae bacterium]|nr:SDR family oxidoreductase [Pseudomonadaceae bacterium]